MNIIDLYSPMQNGQIPTLEGYPDLAESWGITQKSVARWLTSKPAKANQTTAEKLLQEAPSILAKVEGHLQASLTGTLVLMPSFGDFDGFARYDRGHHHVLLGIDFPDADINYLRALTAHELSHVYRDHAPAVWGHLGKPLKEVTRKEYLNASTAEEHLASEGLATWFSQKVFPEIEPRIHHFYEEDEWDWCLKNHPAIDTSLRQCLQTDQDVWSFYSPSRVARGSPSRTHYYWAAHEIAQMPHAKSLSLRQMHELPTGAFSWT
ncbi:MAG: hypothetical protein JNL01_12735 [Bdellovibrionales bacterium]|nr:hypothetical protein [Bdellovibrionales bacterium]